MILRSDIFGGGGLYDVQQKYCFYIEIIFTKKKKQLNTELINS